MRYWESCQARWDMSTINAPDLSFRNNGYDMTGVGLVATTDIVPGPYMDEATEYDGSSEYSVRTVANWRSTDSVGTVAVVAKANAIGADQAMFGTSDEAATEDFMMFRILAGGQIAISSRINNATNAVRGGTVVAAGIWHLFTLTTDGSAWSLGIDGVSEALTVVSGSNDGDWLDAVPDRDNVTIGALLRTSAVNYFNGVIASVHYYDTTLVAAQTADLYQRFQQGRAA